jgi:tyrosine-protein phosphatase SIW14
MKSFKLLLMRRFAVCLLALCAPLALAVAGDGVKGVPNFQTVNDQVYRGGQPTDAGFRNLAARGIKTVIDLRGPGSRSAAEKKLVNGLGMRYVSIPMKGLATPTSAQISQALTELNGKSGAPVFIHCRRGADRTGAVLACYRIEHDNWDNQKALSEARGYGMRWFEVQMQRYVMAYKAKGNSAGLASNASQSRQTVQGGGEPADVVKRDGTAVLAPAQ